MYETNTIAERIKKLVKDRGISQKELLETSGVSWNFMSPLRSGSMPKVDTLAKIADSLNCSVDFLLGRTDSEEPQDEPCFDASPNRLHDIVEVITIGRDEAINARLAQGWIILETFTTCYDPYPPFNKHQNALCLLGRPSGVEPYASDDSA